jgi:hypothetical protein
VLDDELDDDELDDVELELDELLELDEELELDELEIPTIYCHCRRSSSSIMSILPLWELPQLRDPSSGFARL